MSAGGCYVSKGVVTLVTVYLVVTGGLGVAAVSIPNFHTFIYVLFI
jgi:hypothetical protein